MKELKGNTNVKEVSLRCCYLGPRFAGVLSDVLRANETVVGLHREYNKVGPEGARAIAEALRVNRSVKSLDLSGNDVGTEGARALAEALAVNGSVTWLFLTKNNIGDEGARALLEGVKENGSLTFCRVDEFQDEVSAYCQRNETMHRQARDCVVCLMALRRMERVVWIPREMMVIIGHMLLKTKCDLDAWSKC